MTELRNSLDQNCVDFTATRDAQWLDQLAVCDEALLEEFLETDSVKNETIAQAIA